MNQNNNMNKIGIFARFSTSELLTFYKHAVEK
jgi:hypothetical protein